MAGEVSDVTSRAGAPGWLRRMRALIARRETVFYLTSSTLKSGHRNKALGHLWNLLDPLLFMLVYYFVFGILFGQVRGSVRSGDFMLYLFVGLVAWRFMAVTLSQAADCIRGQRSLVHSINFPKSIYPVSHSFAALYDFAWGLLVVVGVLLISGYGLSWHAVLALPILLLHLLFTLGVAFLVALLGTFFADMSNVMQVAIRLWFYMSPVMYYVRGPNSLLGDRADLLQIYMLNPAACFLELYRDVLLYHRLPTMDYLGYAAVVSVVAFVVGFDLFSRNEGKFFKYV